MDRGAGLGYFSSFPEVYDSTSWSTSPTFPGVANEDYLSFVVNVDSGFAADFTRLRIHALPDSDGPNALQLRSSADSFASALTELNNLQSASVQVFDWDFGANPITDFTGSIRYTK